MIPPITPAVPAVSVVIPAYNSIHYLATTLEAVLAQTLTAIEVFVVDDGSTDGTAGFAERYAAADPRLTVLRQANGGVAAARNRGAALARGEFLAFCDSDDWWGPTFLEKAVAVFRASGPDTGAVYAFTGCHDDSGRRLPFTLWSEHQGDVSERLVVQNFIGSGSATVFRRSTFERAGGFSGRFAPANAQGCEDWELLIRVARISAFRYVPEILIHYRRRSGAMSSRFATMARSHALLLDLVSAYWPDLSKADRRAARRNFFLYLSDEAIRLRRAAQCWKWLWKAWSADRIWGTRRRTIYQFAARSLCVTLGLPTKTNTGPQTAWEES